MARIYAILAAAGAIVIAIFVAFQKGAAAGRDKVKAKFSKAAVEQQSKTTKVMVDGLTKEQEVRDAKIDTTKRDHFTRK